MPILPVQVKSTKGNKVIQTYAFLDPGSSATFCSEYLMKELNMCGKRVNIFLRTMGQEQSVSCNVIDGFEISGINSNHFFPLPDVYTQKKMPVSSGDIITQKELCKWSYLDKVRIPYIQADVDLLIGMNASDVIEPYEIINSHGNGPFAIKTLLGWVVNGTMVGNSDRKNENGHSVVTVNRISVVKLDELSRQDVDFQPLFPIEGQFQNCVEVKEDQEEVESQGELEEKNLNVPNGKVFDGCHVDKSVLIETQIQDMQGHYLSVREIIQESVVESEASDQEYKAKVVQLPEDEDILKPDMVLNKRMNQSSEKETKHVGSELNCSIHRECKDEKKMQEGYRALPTEEHSVNNDDLEIKGGIKVTAVVFQGTLNLANYFMAYFTKWKRLAFVWMYMLQNLLNKLPFKEKELLALKRVTKLVHPP